MESKLHSPLVAYQYAGFDHDFTMFKMYTKPMVDPNTKEIGVMEYSHKGVLTELEQAIDPQNWLFIAALNLVQGFSQRHGIPVEAWTIEFSPVMEKFQVPSHLYLDKPRDYNMLLRGRV